jgi:predicted CoA-binding protein
MDDKKKPTVAVIGASSDRSKFGNKSVRAHLAAGYEVFPVNPTETEIEGLKVYKSVADIPGALDRVTIYLPPQRGINILEAIAQKSPKEFYLNPGTESDELIAKAKTLGLEPLLACSIIEAGFSPAEFF